MSISTKFYAPNFFFFLRFNFCFLSFFAICCCWNFWPKKHVYPPPPKKKSILNRTWHYTQKNDISDLSVTHLQVFRRWGAKRVLFVTSVNILGKNVCRWLPPYGYWLKIIMATDCTHSIWQTNGRILLHLSSFQ